MILRITLSLIVRSNLEVRGLSNRRSIKLGGEKILPSLKLLLGWVIESKAHRNYYQYHRRRIVD